MIVAVMVVAFAPTPPWKIVESAAFGIRSELRLCVEIGSASSTHFSLETVGLRFTAPVSASPHRPAPSALPAFPRYS